MDMRLPAFKKRWTWSACRDPYLGPVPLFPGLNFELRTCGPESLKRQSQGSEA